MQKLYIVRWRYSEIKKVFHAIFYIKKINQCEQQDSLYKIKLFLPILIEIYLSRFEIALVETIYVTPSYILL